MYSGLGIGVFSDIFQVQKIFFNCLFVLQSMQGRWCFLACLHAHGAAELFKESSYIPQCDADGEFVSVQAYGSSRFCVDSSGREIQGFVAHETDSLENTETAFNSTFRSYKMIAVTGTRSAHRVPSCNLPRTCPVFSCNLHCHLG